jgi:hypothetical protein
VKPLVAQQCESESCQECERHREARKGERDSHATPEAGVREHLRVIAKADKREQLDELHPVQADEDAVKGRQQTECGDDQQCWRNHRVGQKIDAAEPAGPRGAADREDGLHAQFRRLNQDVGIWSAGISANSLL